MGRTSTKYNEWRQFNDEESFILLEIFGKIGEDYNLRAFSKAVINKRSER